MQATMQKPATSFGSPLLANLIGMALLLLLLQRLPILRFRCLGANALFLWQWCCLASSCARLAVWVVPQ